MKGRLLAGLVVLSSALLLQVSVLSGQGSGEKRILKKRVAVFTFEDKTDHRYLWWNGKSVGDGLSDMLTTALAKSGRYRVLERQELDQVLREQNLGASGAVTQETAAQVGKLLGVELVVVGAVTEFGHSRKDVGGRAKGIGLGVRSQSATVAVDVRFVNSSTGEVVAAETVRKSKTKRGLAVSTPKFDFKNQNEFDQSIVGKAAREAVDSIVELIDRNMENIPWQGMVVKGNGQVFINAGAEAGIQVGDRFVVYRAGEELIDPATGLSLGSTETKIGVIEVTKNDVGQGKASICKIVSGSGFQRGDLVRQE